MSIYAKRNLAATILGDDSVKGDESTLISNHRSIIFISNHRSLVARNTHFIPPHMSVADRAVRSPYGYPSVQIFDMPGNTGESVHHPTADDFQGRVRVMIRPLLEHYEEAVVQFLDTGGLALPMCFQECAASRFQ